MVKRRMSCREKPVKSEQEKLIHDIRNALNSIAMNAELAKLLVAQKGSNEMVIKTLDTILRQSTLCSDRLSVNAGDSQPQ